MLDLITWSMYTTFSIQRFSIDKNSLCAKIICYGKASLPAGNNNTRTNEYSIEREILAMTSILRNEKRKQSDFRR